MMAGRSFYCTTDELIDGTEDIFIASRGLKRPTWPRYALLDHINFDLHSSGNIVAIISRTRGAIISRYPPTFR